MEAPHLFYFAYGSNMNPDRIRQRIPFARAIGKAEIRGWKITERLYADIDRAQGGRVEGVLYLLTPSEIRQLDAYEGYPTVYDSFTVNAYLDDGHKVRAITYAMTAKTKAERNGKPYPDSYRILCAVGARYWNVKNSFGLRFRAPRLL